MDSSVPLVSAETLNQSFEEASKRAASMNVPNESRLDLYGLYKQATQGDCSTKEPSRFNVIEHAKWSAWKKLSGTTDSAAKHAYTELVKNLDPTFDPAFKQNEDKQQADAAEDDQEKVIKIVLEESNNPETEPARVLIQEDVEDVTKPPVTVASVEVPANSTPVNIALETVPSSSQQSSSHLSRTLGLGRPGHDSPVPTWAVFLLGVLFLCFLDDNISFGNMIMNGLGVSVLTAAIISLQMK